MSYDRDVIVVEGEQCGDSLPSIELGDSVSQGDKDKLFILQKQDPNLAEVWTQMGEETEASPVCYYTQNDIFMWKWQPLNALPNEDWKVVK